jgi:hypothetical protein
MRQRADDGNGMLVLGDNRAAIQQLLEPVIRSCGQSERFNSVRFLTLPASR